mmetsp:Transcript_15295/g.26485  ORF Transcript_15295/g.26485 Transcript_15295/m.26485 type:complete len:218 (-) Transcript_15295:603-1256(-)
MYLCKCSVKTENSQCYMLGKTVWEVSNSGRQNPVSIPTSIPLHLLPESLPAQYQSEVQASQTPGTALPESVWIPVKTPARIPAWQPFWGWGPRTTNIPASNLCQPASVVLIHILGGEEPEGQKTIVHIHCSQVTIPTPSRLKRICCYKAINSLPKSATTHTLASSDLIHPIPSLHVCLARRKRWRICFPRNVRSLSNSEWGGRMPDPTTLRFLFSSR